MELPSSACRHLSPQKELSCRRAPSGVSSSREDWLLSQERRLEVDITPGQTLSQIIIPPLYSSKDPLLLPKIKKILPPKRPTTSPPLLPLNGV